MFGLFNRKASEKAPPDPLLRAEDLALASPIDVDRARESGVRSDYEDGGLSLSYQYTFAASDGVLVNSAISIAADEDEARGHFQEYLRGVVDFGLEVERDDRLAFGHEAATWVVSLHGEPRGHAVVVRAGARVWFTIFAGFYFTGPERFWALLEPKLTALERWEPR